MGFFWIAAAGFAGAVVRVWVSGYVTRKLRGVFPWGTFAVNISGTFVLGLLIGFGGDQGSAPAEWLVPASAGFLGAYTTFSTWSLDTVRLAARGKPLHAAANLLLSTLSGLTATALGLLLGTRL